MKFAFFGFCPSSFQSWSQPVKASLWKAPHSFGCQLFTDGLRRRVETSCPEYLCIKRCYPRVASILIVETTLERPDRVNEMIKMTVYRRVMGNFLKLFNILNQSAPFRYYSAEKAILHAVKSTLSVFLVGLYFSLRTQHRAQVDPSS